MSEPKPFSFYEIQPNGKYLFFVDASLLKSFSSCEAYFYLKHVKNLRQKGFTITKPFPMSIGLDACAAAEPDKFAQFGDLSGAVLMLQDYFNSQYSIDKHNWKVVAVEEGFGLRKEVFIGESPRVVVYWVGRPDLVVTENDRLTPVDHKTVSRIDGFTTSRYKPSSQMPGYVHSCEVIAKSLGYKVRVDRCVVNICSRARPSDNPRSGKKRPRFIRAYPNFTREEIDEWCRDVVNKCERIAHCLKTGEWGWSETTCHNFYMRPCDYLKLHSAK